MKVIDSSNISGTDEFSWQALSPFHDQHAYKIEIYSNPKNQYFFAENRKIICNGIGDMINELEKKQDENSLWSLVMGCHYGYIPPDSDMVIYSKGLVDFLFFPLVASVLFQFSTELLANEVPVLPHLLLVLWAVLEIARFLCGIAVMLLLALVVAPIALTAGVAVNLVGSLVSATANFLAKRSSNKTPSEPPEETPEETQTDTPSV